MSNSERQRRYKDAQRALGRKQLNIFVTDEERFYLERVLEEMRETGGKPAAMRDRQGRFYHLDV